MHMHVNMHICIYTNSVKLALGLLDGKNIAASVTGSDISEAVNVMRHISVPDKVHQST